ncbi:hypothetical protein AYI70_g1750 [Smittium culicis]|uniref:Uncharacterized protein n=1 Tax=Smittium culicis TaxID=133412 RepID=A0A1R1YC07_9FUNG|nr:hypothetical protein AYI70_g1750 [Smittium culicis]
MAETDEYPTSRINSNSFSSKDPHFLYSSRSELPEANFKDLSNFTTSQIGKLPLRSLTRRPSSSMYIPNSTGEYYENADTIRDLNSTNSKALPFIADYFNDNLHKSENRSPSIDSIKSIDSSVEGWSHVKNEFGSEESIKYLTFQELTKDSATEVNFIYNNSPESNKTQNSTIKSRNFEHDTEIKNIYSQSKKKTANANENVSRIENRRTIRTESSSNKTNFSDLMHITPTKPSNNNNTPPPKSPKNSLVDNLLTQLQDLQNLYDEKCIQVKTLLSYKGTNSLLRTPSSLNSSPDFSNSKGTLNYDIKDIKSVSLNQAYAHPEKIHNSRNEPEKFSSPPEYNLRISALESDLKNSFETFKSNYQLFSKGNFAPVYPHSILDESDRPLSRKSQKDELNLSCKNISDPSNQSLKLNSALLSSNQKPPNDDSRSMIQKVLISSSARQSPRTPKNSKHDSFYSQFYDINSTDNFEDTRSQYSQSFVSGLGISSYNNKANLNHQQSISVNVNDYLDLLEKFNLMLSYSNNLLNLENAVKNTKKSTPLDQSINQNPLPSQKDSNQHIDSDDQTFEISSLKSQLNYSKFEASLLNLKLDDYQNLCINIDTKLENSKKITNDLILALLSKVSSIQKCIDRQQKILPQELLNSNCHNSYPKNFDAMSMCLKINNALNQSNHIQSTNDSGNEYSFCVDKIFDCITNIEFKNSIQSQYLNFLKSFEEMKNKSTYNTEKFSDISNFTTFLILKLITESNYNNNLSSKFTDLSQLIHNSYNANSTIHSPGYNARLPKIKKASSLSPKSNKLNLSLLQNSNDPTYMIKQHDLNENSEFNVDLLNSPFSHKFYPNNTLYTNSVPDLSYNIRAYNKLYVNSKSPYVHIKNSHYRPSKNLDKSSQNKNCTNDLSSSSEKGQEKSFMKEDVNMDGYESSKASTTKRTKPKKIVTQNKYSKLVIRPFTPENIEDSDKKFIRDRNSALFKSQKIPSLKLKAASLANSCELQSCQPLPQDFDIKFITKNHITDSCASNSMDNQIFEISPIINTSVSKSILKPALTHPPKKKAEFLLDSTTTTIKPISTDTCPPDDPSNLNLGHVTPPSTDSNDLDIPKNDTVNLIPIESLNEYQQNPIHDPNISPRKSCLTFKEQESSIKLRLNTISNYLTYYNSITESNGDTYDRSPIALGTSGANLYSLVTNDSKPANYINAPKLKISKNVKFEDENDKHSGAGELGMSIDDPHYLSKNKVKIGSSGVTVLKSPVTTVYTSFPVASASEIYEGENKFQTKVKPVVFTYTKHKKSIKKSRNNLEFEQSSDEKPKTLNVSTDKFSALTKTSGGIPPSIDTFTPDPNIVSAVAKAMVGSFITDRFSRLAEQIAVVHRGQNPETQLESPNHARNSQIALHRPGPRRRRLPDIASRRLSLVQLDRQLERYLRQAQSHDYGRPRPVVRRLHVPPIAQANNLEILESIPASTQPLK